MQIKEMEKSRIHILKEMIDYEPLSAVSKTIIQNATGYINLVAIDKGEPLMGKVSPFDVFLQVIEGSAEIVIDDKPNLLHQGQAIIIPAHTSSKISSNGRCKMISTVIKSGYEEGMI
jgi:quercetin dioxygenase-like cupin family protein